MEKESYGKMKMTASNGKIEEVEILDFLQMNFKDNRLISIVNTELNTFVLQVENHESSGRNTHQSMHLSKETFLGLITAFLMYCNCKGIDIHDELKLALDENNDEIKFTKTPNLKHFTP